MGTDSNYEWTIDRPTPKRRLHYHRLKRFASWRKGKNAGKTWEEFKQWEKEHPDGVTLESIIRKDAEEEEKWRDYWQKEAIIEEEKQRIANLRKELIRSINKKDWTEDEKRKARAVINMASNVKIKKWVS